MYCAKCGNQVPDGAKFCDACGQAAPQTGEATPATAPQPFPNPDTVSAVGGNTGGGKKSRKVILVVAAAIAIALLAGVLVYANMWRFMSGKSYYNYLESKNITFSFNKTYNDMIKATELEPFSKEIEFTVGNVEDLGDIPMEIDPEDISIKTQIDYSKDKVASYLSLNYDDNVLLDALLYKDKDTIGFGLPLLYDSNFSVKIDEMQEVLSRLTGQEMLEANDLDLNSLEEFKKELDADTKYLDETLAKYLKITVDSISSDSFEKTDVDGTMPIYSWESGDRRSVMEYEGCRQVDIRVTEKDMYNIADKVLEALQKDDKLLELIYKYQNGMSFMEGLSYGYGLDMDDYEEDEYSKKEAIEEMKESLEYEREELEYSFDPDSDRTIMKMEVIADSDNNIISRRIIIGQTSISLLSYTDNDGGKATEINYFEDRSDEDPFILYSYNGEESKSFIIRYAGDTVEMSYSRSDDGKSGIGLDYGTYKIKIDALYDMYEVIFSVSQDNNDKGTDKLRLRVNEGEEELFAVNATVKDLKDKKNVDFKKNKAIDLADVDEYELEEIGEEIQENLAEIIMELQYMMY